jgi:prolyl 4-hydroxylase
MSIQALEKAARAGDSKAQLQLGIALMSGQGVPAQDLDAGRGWLQRAADQGHHDAQRFLGMIYMRGMDVVPDFELAVEFLASAAGSGDAEAGWWLACFLGGSRDEYFDPERAFRQLKRAASAGQPRSMCHLGYALMTGCLGQKDPEQAMEWFIAAAGRGDPGALLAVAEFCATGYYLPADPGRALKLAVTAAESGWQVAGEYARSLGVDPTHAAASPLPDIAEISPSHGNEMPAPELSVASWAPRVIVIRRLLSAFECAEIANAAAEHLMPSFIVDADGNLGTHQIRTSHEVRLRPGIRNIVINAVEKRMAEWSQFPLENGEFPLVLHYQDEQSFEQHFDYFIPEKFVLGEGPLEFGGQRVATQLIYLNEDFEGGETRFDNSGLVMRPERGACMLFHNLKPDHNVDPLTRHTGVAVTRGAKWLLSRWIRELPFDQPAAGHKRDKYRED